MAEWDSVNLFNSEDNRFKPHKGETGSKDGKTFFSSTLHNFRKIILVPRNDINLGDYITQRKDIFVKMPKVIYKVSQILQNTSLQKNNITLKSLGVLKSSFSCIHQRRAVRVARCRAYASAEQTSLNPGVYRNNVQKIIGADQKTPAATIYVVRLG